MSKSDRATMDELREFANAVRAAGGGNPIDALMPSVPEDPTACLIAKNLNFNCSVQGAENIEGGRESSEDLNIWAMYVNDKVTRDKIAASLTLVKCESRVEFDPAYGVVLPDRIAQVAQDFDQAGELFSSLKFVIDDVWYDGEAQDHWNDLDSADQELIRDFLPYIEESEAEAYGLATIINPDGSITL